MNRPDLPLSQEERDKLSKDALLDYDLRHVRRDPRVSEKTLRNLVTAKVRRERDDRRIARQAEEAGTTSTAIRQAEAEQRAERRRRQQGEDLAAARRAVELHTPPPPTSYAQQSIPGLIAEWRAAEDRGEKPSQRSVAATCLVNRESVSNWIKAGWLKLPPD
jgi:hypothetical protein